MVFSGFWKCRRLKAIPGHTIIRSGFLRTNNGIEKLIQFVIEKIFLIRIKNVVTKYDNFYGQRHLTGN